MGCVGCKGSPRPAPVPLDAVAGEGEVLVRYIGPKKAPLCVRGSTGRTYVIIPGRAIPMLSTDVARISAVIPLALEASVQQVEATVITEPTAAQTMEAALVGSTVGASVDVDKEQKAAFLGKVLQEMSGAAKVAVSPKTVTGVYDEQVKQDAIADSVQELAEIEADEVVESAPAEKFVKPKAVSTKARGTVSKRGRPRKVADDSD